MGCWGLLGSLLIVSQWIIPSFPAFCTSKFCWDKTRIWNHQPKYSNHPINLNACVSLSLRVFVQINLPFGHFNISLIIHLNQVDYCTTPDTTCMNVTSQNNMRCQSLVLAIISPCFLPNLVVKLSEDFALFYLILQVMSSWKFPSCHRTLKSSSWLTSNDSITPDLTWTLFFKCVELQGSSIRMDGYVNIYIYNCIYI